MEIARLILFAVIIITLKVLVYKGWKKFGWDKYLYLALAIFWDITLIQEIIRIMQ